MKSGKSRWADPPDAGRQIYIGRFAPSPTGPLHFGSLYTALASFLDARSHRGRWLLRIDDLDTARNVDGAAETITRTLESFGLLWDGEIAYESRNVDTYHEHYDTLARHRLIYPCTCSRKNLAANLADHAFSDIYPGYCRNRTELPESPHAWRIKTDSRNICFHDALQGLITENLARQHGDFVVKRKDHIIAYQFAVVIDDHLQQVSHVVRGADLLDSTAKQIYLQQLLELPTPAYLHVPLIVDEHGAKLSKQTLATAVDAKHPEPVILQLLKLLKQNPPDELDTATLAELLDWAIAHWNPAPLQNTRSVLQPYF